MAGNLIQVDTFTVSGAVGSVTLGGGTDGSSSNNFEINTDDVYMVAFNNMQPETDIRVLYSRVTKTDGSGGGTPDSTGNYDEAYKGLYSDTGFPNGQYENSNQWAWGWNGTGTSETSQGIMYLYNFNSSGYSFMQAEIFAHAHDTTSRAFGSGGAHTVASASNGITFLYHTGNIASGTFTLYKVV
tara:strand:- start:806 stop:1360 length:555 start_codon:yes stop_codon:yes gene_type:complete